MLFRSGRSTDVEIDLRYHGQGMQLTVPMTLDAFKAGGLAKVAKTFDDTHTQLFTFALDAPHELVNLRAIVRGADTHVAAGRLERADTDPSAARIETTTIFVEGADHEAPIYDRQGLAAGHRIVGPAIVVEMDSTTLILPGHAGDVDDFGNILIRPVD